MKDRLLATAFDLAPRLPGRLVRAAAHLGADATWLVRGSGVKQLEKNLVRIGAATPETVAGASRQAMRHYMRYYAEALQLSSLTPEQVDARVSVVMDPKIAEQCAKGSVILTLGHLGNWDLAGAWASRHLAPVLTVAEHLKPEEVFQAFVALREAVGMTILPLDKGGAVFPQLLRRSRTERRLVCLLADRDLSRSGVPAQICGHPARVAAGPAALSLAAKIPLYFVGSRHVRLTGERRRRAGTPWGMELEFSEPCVTDLKGAEGVADLTAQWTAHLSDYLRRYPLHWHMLQPVFDADLDMARIEAKQGSGT